MASGLSRKGPIVSSTYRKVERPRFPTGAAGHADRLGWPGAGAGGAVQGDPRGDPAPPGPSRVLLAPRDGRHAEERRAQCSLPARVGGECCR